MSNEEVFTVTQEECLFCTTLLQRIHFKLCIFLKNMINRNNPNIIIEDEGTDLCASDLNFCLNEVKQNYQLLYQGKTNLIKNSRNRTSHQASNVGYDDAHQVVLAINTLIKHLVVPPTPELLCSLYKAKNALFKNSREKSKKEIEKLRNVNRKEKSSEKQKQFKQSPHIMKDSFELLHAKTAAQTPPTEYPRQPYNYNYNNYEMYYGKSQQPLAESGGYPVTYSGQEIYNRHNYGEYEYPILKTVGRELDDYKNCQYMWAQVESIKQSQASPPNNAKINYIREEGNMGNKLVDHFGETIVQATDYIYKEKPLQVEKIPTTPQKVQNKKKERDSNRGTQQKVPMHDEDMREDINKRKDMKVEKNRITRKEEKDLVPIVKKEQKRNIPNHRIKCKEITSNPSPAHPSPFAGKFTNTSSSDEDW